MKLFQMPLVSEILFYTFLVCYLICFYVSVIYLEIYEVYVVKSMFHFIKYLSIVGFAICAFSTGVFLYFQKYIFFDSGQSDN